MAERGTFWIGALTAALCACALASPLRAAEPLPLNETELVEGSDWIGLVQVLDARSEWRDEKLWTRVQLRVVERLKGRWGSAITLVVPGGVDAEKGVEQQVPGVPLRFAQGSRMVVFGVRSRFARGAIQPVALGQGLLAADAAAPARAGLFLAPDRRAADAEPGEGERVRALLDAIRMEMDRAAEQRARMEELAERSIRHSQRIEQLEQLEQLGPIEQTEPRRVLPF